jgi:hypothetical protein
MAGTFGAFWLATMALYLQRVPYRRDLVSTFERALTRWLAYGVARQLGLGVVGVVVVGLMLWPALKKVRRRG